ncbi:MAG: LamG-like jellyroll fold domain-containing protein [Bacteroidia bacterium]
MKTNRILPRLLSIVITLLLANAAMANPHGDTTVVNTFNYSSQVRNGMFHFPDDTTVSYEKIIMLYSMRCKNGLVSSSSNTNLGCGEWDYNCYTYLIDSAQTDSLAATHSSHDISNFTGTSYGYTTLPLWNYIQTNQQEVLYTSTLSESSYATGNASTVAVTPLNGSQKTARHQFLYTAGELSSLGMAAGDISGMALDLNSFGGNLTNLRIRMKTTTASSLSGVQPELTGFTEVYYLSTAFNGNGQHRFNFHTNFSWNGIDNLIVEFLFDNPAPTSDNDVVSSTTPFVSSLINNTEDNYIEVNGGTTTIDLPSSVGTFISNKITLAFWVYGNPNKLPANTSIFEAVDANNVRQLNLHLPWSDGSIYWDCGNDGTGYDRINKAATTSEIEGQWNFWAVTKDATTGEMKIFLNGHPWHSGTGKTKLISIDRMKISTSINGGYLYYGGIDDFSIWNTALDSAEINQLMAYSVQPSMPSYGNLIAWYPFDQINGSSVQDFSSNGNDATQFNVIPRLRRSADLFHQFTETYDRPDATFYNGTYVTQVNTFPVLDSVAVPANSVVSYAVVNNTLQVVDTSFYWPANGYTYTYDASGTPIDSQYVSAMDTIQLTTLNYFNKYPSRIELINFITPYGINLNMNGLIGKTWAFDVTDFAPVLRGDKFLSMEGGNHQEDNDITFVFYKGTPPRDVKSIQQIWPNGSRQEVNSTQILNNTVFEPRNVTLSSAASQFKIRSQISGHGQEGEFIARNHTIRLNNTTNFTRSVWTECATNPIYPQGGTWVYDRAGWCPGASVILKEWELTSYVTPGQTINLDYTLPTAANYGDSRYRVNNQLVSYGAPNFTNDAAVGYVKNPTDYVEFERTNPICNQPIVAIKNTGSNTLTSLDITYGRLGGTMSTYTWTGSLAFLQSAEVTLPQPAWLSSNSNQFIAIVSNPNGQADQYGLNDTMLTTFNYPAVYPQHIVFELKTNALGGYTSYTLKDSQGNTIINRSGLASNTTYRDTVNLQADCYVVHLNDADDDGLSWWANTSQGTGYFRIKNAVSGAIIKQFNSDFGDNIHQEFTINYTLPVNEIAENISNLVVAPNPAASEISVYFSMSLGSNATLEIVNVLGQVMQQQQVYAAENINRVPVDISTLSEGVYYVVLRAGNNKQMQKLVVTR